MIKYDKLMEYCYIMQVPIMERVPLTSFTVDFKSTIEEEPPALLIEDAAGNKHMAIFRTIEEARYVALNLGEYTSAQIEIKSHEDMKLIGDTSGYMIEVMSGNTDLNNILPRRFRRGKFESVAIMTNIPIYYNDKYYLVASFDIHEREEDDPELVGDARVLVDEITRVPMLFKTEGDAKSYMRLHLNSKFIEMTGTHIEFFKSPPDDILVPGTTAENFRLLIIGE